MYRDGTGVPPWKEISGGFAPSQPTGEGAVSAGYSRVGIKFFKLDQSRQGFSSKCATRNWGKGHGVPHRHLWSSLWQSPKLHEPLQQVEGVSWITLNNKASQHDVLPKEGYDLFFLPTVLRKRSYGFRRQQRKEARCQGSCKWCGWCCPEIVSFLALIFVT